MKLKFKVLLLSCIVSATLTSCKNTRNDSFPKDIELTPLPTMSTSTVRPTESNQTHIYEYISEANEIKFIIPKNWNNNSYRIEDEKDMIKVYHTFYENIEYEYKSSEDSKLFEIVKYKLVEGIDDTVEENGWVFKEAYHYQNITDAKGERWVAGYGRSNGNAYMYSTGKEKETIQQMWSDVTNVILPSVVAK